VVLAEARTNSAVPTVTKSSALSTSVQDADFEVARHQLPTASDPLKSNPKSLCARNPVDSNRPRCYLQLVESADATLNFPFVESLPKREASPVVRVWDRIQGLIASSDEHGVLLPVSVVAKALNVGRTRVDQLVEAGHLKRVDIYDHVFISSKSLREYAQTPRLPGRRITPSSES